MNGLLEILEQERAIYITEGSKQLYELAVANDIVLQWCEAAASRAVKEVCQVRSRVLHEEEVNIVLVNKLTHKVCRVECDGPKITPAGLESLQLVNLVLNQLLLIVELLLLTLLLFQRERFAVLEVDTLLRSFNLVDFLPLYADLAIDAVDVRHFHGAELTENKHGRQDDVTDKCAERELPGRLLAAVNLHVQDLLEAVRKNCLSAAAGVVSEPLLRPAEPLVQLHQHALQPLHLHVADVHRVVVQLFVQQIAEHDDVERLNEPVQYDLLRVDQQLLLEQDHARVLQLGQRECHR